MSWEELKDSDIRPFPIQGNWASKREEHEEPCTVPWWLAEIAYEYYSEKCGTIQSLERLAERGGFGRAELVAFIRKDLGGLR